MQTNQTNLQGHASENSRKMQNHATWKCWMLELTICIFTLCVVLIRISRTSSRAYHIILTNQAFYSYFLHLLRSGIIGTSHLFSPLRRHNCTTLCHQEGEGRKFFQQAIRGALDKYGLVVTLWHVWAPTLGGFMCPKQVFFMRVCGGSVWIWPIWVYKWHESFYCEYGPVEFW